MTTEADLPIDIHSSKLLDWLVSRRHSGKDWQKAVLKIREDINHAIQDMPEDEQVVRLLQGTYINYFHCVRIVAILKETEKDSRNFLGYYSSQRMKDWQQIVGAYEQDGVFLSEGAQILQRFVQYDIPALKKLIARCQQGIEESRRKENDYERQSKESRRNFERECVKMGIDSGQSAHIRRQLVALATDLPSFFQKIALDIRTLLTPSMQYYAVFRKYILKKEEDINLLVVLHLIADKGSQVTAFEWKHGHAPSCVETPSLALAMDTADQTDDDVIDFGDGLGEAAGDIDFGMADIAVVADDAHGQLDEGVARGDEALSVFENPQSQRALIADLNELLAFVSWRLIDETTETAADLVLGGRGSTDTCPLKGPKVLQQWLTDIQALLDAFTNPQKRHLFKIRASPRYVESLAAGLEQKRSLEGKYGRMGELMKERQKELAEEAAQTQPRLSMLIDATRDLQKQLESEISKKYKGRPVNIMGGITAALIS